MERKGLVPRLRFPEFRESGEWDNPRLGDISIPIDERVGERSLTPISISAGVGFVPQAEKFGRDIAGNQYRLYTVVRDGDFVYNKGNSLKFPQGCIYDLQGWGAVAAPNVFICFRLKDGYINGFFRQCFAKNAHGRQLKKDITSGARSNGLLNISKETFFGIRIPTPSKEEQTRIADCLSSLDDLISAESRQLDALKEHKKGLIQVLFPQEGERVPRLRFPEFLESGGWKREVLSNHIIPYVDKVSAMNNVFPIFSSSRLGLIQQSEYYLDREIANEGSYGVVPSGFFVYRHMSDDTTFKFNINNTGSSIAVSKEYPVFTTNTLNSIFLLYTLNEGVDFKIFAEMQRKGGTRTRLYFSVLTSFSTLFPSLEEQTRIADCLSSLDDLISAQSRKVETLKTFKQGLMQQMFPVSQ